MSCLNSTLVGDRTGLEEGAGLESGTGSRTGFLETAEPALMDEPKTEPRRGFWQHRGIAQNKQKEKTMKKSRILLLSK